MKKFLIFLIVSLIIINLGYLNYTLFFAVKPTAFKVEEIIPSRPSDNFPLTKVFDSEGKETLLPDYSAITESVRDATAAMTLRIAALEKATPAPFPVSPKTTVKEYYIPLGSSKLTAANWTDVAGAEAYVAPANFGGIKEMYFEASLKVPSGVGTAYARLKNVTDNVSLFESELSRVGGDPGLESSGKIPIPSQTKLYRVQVKSSLSAEVEVVSARIKLFVQ